MKGKRLLVALGIILLCLALSFVFGIFSTTPHIKAENIEALLSLRDSVFENSQTLRPALQNRLIISAEEVIQTKRVISSNEDELTTKFYGLSVRGVLKKADIKEYCLVIYHQGHGGDPFKFEYHNELRKQITERGCDFLSLSMIGLGPNQGPAHFPGAPEELDATGARTHENYAAFRDPRHPYRDPLSLFLSGQYWMIDSLAADYERIFMIGISGGGWMTTLLGALMPQIDRTISYAGGLPIAMRVVDDDMGDYEQIDAPLWEDYDYWHLYFLGTVDEQAQPVRDVTLVYNSNDSCCFADPAASILRDTLTKLEYINVLVVDSYQHTMDPSLVMTLLFPADH